MGSSQNDDAYVVDIAPATVGEGLAKYLQGLPPRLRGYELARYAYLGFQSALPKAKRKEAKRRGKEEQMLPVVNMIGGMIEWV